MICHQKEQLKAFNLDGCKYCSHESNSLIEWKSLLDGGCNFTLYYSKGKPKGTPVIKLSSPVATFGTFIMACKPKLTNDPIIISGISVRLPESDNIQEFAENLFNGVDMVSEDSSSRRWTRGLYGLPPRTGKLKRLDQFDAAAFGLSEKQANVMDPMLRILLELTFEAVYDAGVNPTSLRASKTGVFVGAAKSESMELLLADPDSVNEFNLIGHSRGMFANAISSHYDLHGPSLTTETACSSSLQALERAVAAIRSGQCDSAIVGGANLLLKPQASVEFHKLNMLAPDGKCKAFDASANGYVRSEAVVVVYIQKVNPTVIQKSYATILNIKSNSDGYKEQGITYPSGHMQSQLLYEVYSEIGLDPHKVVFVEAHGTGTAIGDPQETNAIAEHFCGEGRSSDNQLLIGSVKSNMGHSEHASGLCALAKVIVAIVYGKIPGNLHFKDVNPNIPALVDGRLKVVDSCHDLDQHGLIGINSFGFGGSNVHLVLKPNLAHSGPGVSVTRHCHELPVLLPFSGRTPSSTRETMEKLAQNLDYASEITDLYHRIYSDDIAMHNHRGFLIMNSESGAIEESFVQTIPCDEQPQLWLIFSGMGSQWPGMGKSLLKFEPFKTSIEECCSILEPYDIDLWNILTSSEESALESTLHSFVAVAAVQIGLVDLLTAVGITTVDGVIGHSIGENVCAYVDGYATKEQTLLVPYWAGLLFQKEHRTLNPGTMATIGLSWEETKARFPPPPSLYLACHNASDNVSVAGPVAEVHAFVEQLKIEGIFAREIKAGQAFHSPYISSLEQKLHQLLLNNRVLPNNSLKRSSKWISTSYPEHEWNSEQAKYISSAYFAHNLVSPVLFKEALEKIPSNSIVLEIGPHCLLQPILKRSLSGMNATVLGISSRNAVDNTAFVLTALGKIWTTSRHHTLNWSALYTRQKQLEMKQPIFLSPLVSWDHEKYFRVVNFVQDSKSTHLNTIKIDRESDHEFHIDGQSEFPHVGYLILIWKHLAQNRELDFESMPITFTDVHFHQSVTLSENEKMPTQFSINALESSGKFEVMHEKQVVCSGRANATDSGRQVYTKCQNGWTKSVIWSGNLVAYLESLVKVARLSLLERESDPVEVFILSKLDYVYFDPTQLRAKAKELVTCNILQHQCALVAPGIEFRGIGFKTHFKPIMGNPNINLATDLTSKVNDKILPIKAESKACNIQFAFIQLSPNQDPILNSLAGTNPAGEAVMGLSGFEFLWKIPKNWKLADAAVIPFSYAVAFYVLNIKAELKVSGSVLIPMGMSEIGQASIAVALSWNATVFVTVASCQEKKTLMSMYSALNENQIIIVNAKGLGFACDVLDATNGCGVDVVMNSGQATLQESLQCLKQHGRFLHIQEGSPGGESFLGLAPFLNNITFYGINLAETGWFFNSNSNVRGEIFELISNGIRSGIVKPIQSSNIWNPGSHVANSDENVSSNGRMIVKIG